MLEEPTFNIDYFLLANESRKKSIIKLWDIVPKVC